MQREKRLLSGSVPTRFDAPLSVKFTYRARDRSHCGMINIPKVLTRKKPRMMEAFLRLGPDVIEADAKEDPQVCEVSGTMHCLAA